MHHWLCGLYPFRTRLYARAHAHCPSMSLHIYIHSDNNSYGPRRLPWQRQPDNERAPGWQKRHEQICIFELGHIYKRVLSVYVIIAEYIAARHVAEAALARVGLTALLGGEGNDQTPGRAFRKRVGNIRASLKLDCGFSAGIEVNLALLVLGSLWRLWWCRWQVQSDYISVIVIVKQLHSFIISRLLSTHWGLHLEIPHIFIHYFWIVVHQCCCLIAGYCVCSFIKIIHCLVWYTVWIRIRMLVLSAWASDLLVLGHFQLL